MSNRRQTVEIQGVLSSETDCVCGVPQGSVLGPLLFLIYVNDIPNVSDTLKFRLFADDTGIFLSAADGGFLNRTMNNELVKISKWFKANKLSLNTDKTCFILFHSQYRKVDFEDFRLYIDSTRIKRKTHTKYLGLIIDENLSWKQHCQHINDKNAKSTGIMSKLRHYTNLRTLKSVYYSILYPYLFYGVTCWGSAAEYVVKPLQVIQNKTLKTMLFLRYDSPTNPVYRRLRTLKIKEIYDQQCLLFIHQYHHNI